MTNLVFIYGPPSTGKLTVANELSNITGYNVFRNHEVIGLLATIFPYDDEDLSKIRKKLARGLRLEIFQEAAKTKVNLVTTFGMAGPEYFDFFREVQDVVSKAGGKVLFVQIIASKQVLLSRVGSPDRKNIKIDSKDQLEKLLDEKPEMFDKFPDIEHLTIDNSNLSAQEVAQKIATEYNLS